MKKRIPLPTFVFFAMLFLSACGNSAQAPQNPAATLPPVIDSSEVSAEGRLEPIREAEIAFTASGVISEVLVEEGQTVKMGEPLIRLGDASDINYAAAQLELFSAQKALNDLLNTSGTELAQAVIDLKQAREDYNKADDYLRYLQNSKKVPRTEVRSYLVQTWKGYEYRTRTKYFKGPAPEDWIIEAENDLALKKANLQEAQNTYNRLQGGVDSDQLAVLQARLDAAKAGVAAFLVTAPFDGVVADLNAQTGSSINAGEPAVTIADLSHWFIKTTDLTEIDVVELAEGQPVVVTLDAIPNVELKGKISSIAQSYTENQGDVVYEVTVLLTDTDPRMRWGMTAEVKIEH